MAQSPQQIQAPAGAFPPTAGARLWELRGIASEKLVAEPD